MDRGYLMFLAFCLLLSEHEADDKHRTTLSRKRRYVVFPEGSTFSIALCMTVHTLTPDNIFTEGLNWGISYDLPNESKPVLEPFLELRNDKLKSGNKHRYDATAIVNKNGAIKYSGWNNNDVNSYFAPNRKKYRKSEYYYLQRRHRRDLYNKLEVIMNAQSLSITQRKNLITAVSAQHILPQDLSGHKVAVMGQKNCYRDPIIRGYYKEDNSGRKQIGFLRLLSSMGFDGRMCVLRALCEASQRLMPKGNTLVEEMMRISFSLPLKKVFSFEPREHHTYTEAHKAGHEGKDCATMFPGCSFSLIDLALGKYNAPPSDPSEDSTDYDGTLSTEDEPSTDWPRYYMK